jgi:predicted NBD/HSP70 family sugar kinase
MKALKIARTADANFQNQVNRSIIFNYLRNNSPTYRARISKDLKISAPAVSRVIDSLLQEGYVLETEKIKTGGGKRPTQLRINAGKGCVIGFDLEKLKIAVTDFCGKILQKYDIAPFLNDKNVEGRIKEEISNVYLKCHAASPSSAGNIAMNAICIGIPAAYDAKTEKIVNAPLYESLRGLDIKRAIQQEFHVPVYIENIVKLSALGEKFYGIGKEFEDIVFIEVSNGVGAGIIVDNHLLKGAVGCSGEIGFTILSPGKLGYRAKNKGYLESIASVESIKQKAVDEIKSGKKSLITDMVGGNLKTIDASVVCKAALQKDKVAEEVILTIVKVLAIGVINCILILNPQIVILGGAICNLPGVHTLFTDPIAGLVKNTIPFYTPEIVLSELGEDAGIIGAYYMAIESLVIGEFPYSIMHDDLM